VQGNREEWQANQQQRQQDRQAYAEDLADEYGRRLYDYYDAADWVAAGMVFAVGATLTASAVQALSCQMSPVVIHGVTYYQCGTTWHQRSFSGGDLSYVAIEARSGS